MPTLIIRPMTRSALLSGQTNGRLSPDILTTVPGQAGGAAVTLIHPAARSWVALCAAAKAAGHTLKIGWPNSAYRSYDDQVRIFRERFTTTYLAGRPRRTWQGKTWYLKPGMALAAIPGTSNHGWASAVDAGEERDADLGTESFDDPTLRWLLDNTERYGWSHEVPSEPWHLRYNAGDRIPQAVLDYERQHGQPTTPTTPPVVAPPTTEDEDDDMQHPAEIVMGDDLNDEDKAAWYLTDRVTKQWVQNRQHAALLIQGGHKAKDPGTANDLTGAKIVPFKWPQKAVDSIRLVGPTPT